MEFYKKWINWVVESGDKKLFEQLGTHCYIDNQWVKTLPEFEGEKTKENIMQFLKGNFTEFTFTATERGFTVNLNNAECYCPLIQSKITDNPALCDCTRNFDSLMYEKMLNLPVEVEIVETVLRDKSSCIFEILLRKL